MARDEQSGGHPGNGAVNGSSSNGTAQDRAADWADRARGMLAGFPTGAAKEAAALVFACYERGGKVLACGNGGSGAEAQTPLPEPGGKFEREGASPPALRLARNPAPPTPAANDYNYAEAFPPQGGGWKRTRL